MDFVLLAARLILVLVFGVAGIAKLKDIPGTRATIREFGFPQFIAFPAAILLPILELGVAILLLPNSTAWWGAIGAATFIVVFTLVIVINLARGKTPDCNCFGAIHVTNAGWPTVRRNSVLGLVALLIVLVGWENPGHSAIGWIAAISPIGS